MYSQVLPRGTSIDRAGREGINSTSENGGFFMKPWRWALLIIELFLVALILVLPQVDLPDFTFHRGSAPVIVKARLSSGPILAMVATPVQPLTAQYVGEVKSSSARRLFGSASHSLLSLLCTFLC